MESGDNLTRRGIMEGGGREVRKVHIIYFLSRKGRIEHPHLIRVHHHSPNGGGVRLRDVKRWLSELRGGKEMPESFAWSYKRKYKAGYVWQDLLDEDLITPISDNEYVLKGSEIVPSTTFGHDNIHSNGAKKVTREKEAPQEPIQIESKGHRVSFKEEIQEFRDSKMDVTTKTSSEIEVEEEEEESPPFSSESSTLTDDSTKIDEKSSNTSKQGTNKETDKFENNSSSFYSNLLHRNSKKNNSNNKSKSNSNDSSKTTTTSASSPSSSHSSFARSKSYSSGASHKLRNFITCGGVDTNDSAMVVINRGNKHSDDTSTASTDKLHESSRELRKGEKLGGSERVLGSPWIYQHQDYSARKSFDGVKVTKKKNHKQLSAAYRPINGPNCS